MSKGKALADGDRRHEAVGIYRDVVAAYRHDRAPEVRLAVAKAIHNAGVTLRDLGHRQEALAMFDQLLALATGDPTPGMADLVRSATCSAPACPDGPRSRGVAISSAAAGACRPPG